MKYDLNKLEWQQFELLAYNCLQELISPSLKFIDEGSDKGRDFEYEGITTFFDDTAKNKNYIFQVKHKSDKKYRSKLKSDLSSELQKVYIKNKLSYDVYCLVTNLALSGDFLDELNEVFTNFIEKNKQFKKIQFKIISYRNLETTIDKNQYIKYRYSSILNPKDLEFLLTQSLKRGSKRTSEIWYSIFKNNSEKFIFTNVQERAIEVIKDKNIILFSGPAKSGKTFNAQALIFNFCCTENFTPFYVIDLNNFEDLYEKDHNQIFLFDDAFGKHNLDKTRSDILDRKLEQIFESIDNKHLFVFTSREYVYRSFQQFTDQDTSKFIQKITVKVTELSLTEKESIFERYYKCTFGTTFNISEEKVNSYVNHNKFSPETIRSYFDNTDVFNHKEFVSHLKKPDQYLATVFKNLPQEKQQTLLAILFSNNGKIKNISYSFKNILKDSGNTSLINLEEELSIMEDSIISYINENYSFYHPSMNEFFLNYLSLEAGNYRTLAFKNLSIELLSLISFSELQKDELRIKIDISDIDEISTGFERIILNPNTEIKHLNSIFTWLGSSDILVNFRIKNLVKFNALKTKFIENFSQEALRTFEKFDVIEFDFFMRNLKILFNQEILIAIFNTRTINKIISSNSKNSSSWIIVFHLIHFIESKNELFRVVSRDWLNDFYNEMKIEINKLGNELFGNVYPEFLEKTEYEKLISEGKILQANKLNVKSYANYKQKTSRTWYPRYLKIKRKMASLKNSKPHGYKIYIMLEKAFSPMTRLEDNQRNRYFFLLEKGVWKDAAP